MKEKIESGSLSTFTRTSILSTEILQVHRSSVCCLQKQDDARHQEQGVKERKIDEECKRQGKRNEVIQ